MARTVRDAKLDTRTARLRLREQDTIYWRTLLPGQLHLGYRRRNAGTAGLWIARLHLGSDSGQKSPYIKKNLGVADDTEDADGARVLSFAQAQAAAMAFVRKRDEPEVKPRLTVKEAVADYLEFLRGHRKSAADAERRARTHILLTLGDLAVESLTLSQLVEWRDAMAAAPARLRSGRGKQQRFRAPPATDAERRARRATVNRTVTVLKAALNRALEHERVQSASPPWQRLRSFEQATAARATFLTKEQAKRLVNACDPGSGFRDLVQAALLTGCRYGELCRLRVGDFAHGRIAIRDSKSGRPREVRLTETGRRFFEMLVAGRSATDVLIRNHGRITRAEERERERAERRREEPDFSAARLDPGDWRPSEQARPMMAACAAARITPAIGFHQLRHTWASHAVMDGMPLMVVARSLGHADTGMVEKHYGHLATDYLDEVFARHAPDFGLTVQSNIASADAERGRRSA